ncbi:MAG TPA: hydroxyisourate hydrolase [Streptosporangiaceae bacterium]|jgi:5-hydroxyisourate hydrolase
MSLSTHVLDATLGQPAAGVVVRLERRGDDGSWSVLGAGRTGPDGRLAGWLPKGEPRAGMHRLVFDTGGYFAGRGVPTLYPEVIIAFEADGAAGHYHLPLLLSPFAYSTYRGS